MFIAPSPGAGEKRKPPGSAPIATWHRNMTYAGKHPISMCQPPKVQ